MRDVRFRQLVIKKRRDFQSSPETYALSVHSGLVEIKISELDPTKEFPKRTREDDRLIDEAFGIINIAEELYYTSEALYGVDPFAYGNVAANLRAGIKPSEDETEA